MADVKNYQEVVDIASKHLGKVGGDGYKDTYAPELLVKVPRYLHREGYGLTDKDFVGVDTWNCYEVSAITKKGLLSSKTFCRMFLRSRTEESFFS